jgi:hypothetical protein
MCPGFDVGLYPEKEKIPEVEVISLGCELM